MNLIKKYNFNPLLMNEEEKVFYVLLITLYNRREFDSLLSDSSNVKFE